ncbi:uncharacterized protein C8R40DRAFT_515459 [Lentinula edodes]|uniref:uncharacterized protein n=1 Tax=Lentinula edodes TaxID=5353 RepID=UPI001E8E7F3E|nr:uncharacterized protein C8R40DRAFT_515459 [Lentinula edodes]KAH7871969.1 hypothetical protein C8R40DRAFT_515459 [Lentinula edodes]
MRHTFSSLPHPMSDSKIWIDQIKCLDGDVSQGFSQRVTPQRAYYALCQMLFRPIYNNTKLGPGLPWLSLIDILQNVNLELVMAGLVRKVTTLIRSFSSRKKIAAIDVTDTAVNDPDTQLPQQPQSPLKPRSTPRTLSGSAKLLLDVLQCVSGDVPFTGLGAVVGGLQVLFGQYEKLTDNNADIDDLHQNLERLRKYIEPIKDDIPESFKEFLTINLAPDIAIITDDINAEIDKVKKPSVLARFLSAAHDAKVIAELARRVNSMFADIMMQIHRMTLRVTMQDQLGHNHAPSRCYPSTVGSRQTHRGPGRFT